MINDQDRSGYIGASDTRFVMGSWKTKTFDNWWRTKQGFPTKHFQNVYTMTGTAYEHKILDSLGFPLEKDKQIIKGRLRVNLDGNTKDKVIEVKTYILEKGFTPSKAYRMQVQVEMYALEVEKALLVAYGLEEEDYRNFYRDIDKNRLSFFEYEKDEEFLSEYLKRLKILEECLEKGTFPKE